MVLLPVERHFWWLTDEITEDQAVFLWLPRPSKSKYPGSFPLWFEKNLFELVGLDPEKARIFHPFGGCAEYGERLELPIRQEYFCKNVQMPHHPHYWGDAHDLTRLTPNRHGVEEPEPISLPDNAYDFVVCDPHYTPKEGQKLYDINPKEFPLRRNKWQAEAVRVTKPGGFVALYHRLLLPRPEGCSWKYIIAIATRVNHEGRFCGVFTKDA